MANDVVVVVVTVEFSPEHPIRGLGILDRRIVANQNRYTVFLYHLSGAGERVDRIHASI